MDAAKDIDAEIRAHETENLNPADIAILVENITKAKLELLKNEMNGNIKVFASNLHMDVKISKQIETKMKIKSSMKINNTKPVEAKIPKTKSSTKAPLS